MLGGTRGHGIDNVLVGALPARGMGITVSHAGLSSHFFALGGYQLLILRSFFLALLFTWLRRIMAWHGLFSPFTRLPRFS